jgi:hypothetical protein
LQYTSIGYHNSANSDECQVPNRLRSAGQYLVKFAAEKHRPIPGQVNTRKGSTSPNGVISRTVPSPMYVCEAFNIDFRLDPEVNQLQTESENELRQYLCRLHNRVNVIIFGKAH